MQGFWELGPSPIRDIQETWPEKGRPAYTTVQTIVYRLERKGALRRKRKIGNAHIFEPLVTREDAVSRLVDEVIGRLGGSVRTLVEMLVSSGRLTAKDLSNLRSSLAK
jgi:predicted transcriptional regulator